MQRNLKLIVVFPDPENDRSEYFAALVGGCAPLGGYEAVPRGITPDVRALELCLDMGFVPENLEVIESLRQGEYATFAALVSDEDCIHVSEVIRIAYGPSTRVTERDYKLFPAISAHLRLLQNRMAGSGVDIPAARRFVPSDACLAAG